MLVLDTREVTKRFGGLTAVNQVSMQVEEGQIYGLIGPNGAGKSTFLNSVVGRFPPTEGAVYFQGEETTGLSAEIMCHKGIARTFQIPRPFPQLTVLENVMLPMMFQGTERMEREEYAMELLRKVELADRADHYEPDSKRPRRHAERR